MMCKVLLQCNRTKLKTQGLPVFLNPAPQVTHRCLREVSLESVPEFVKFSFTVHSDTYTIWVTVTLVRLARAAGRLENDSTQEILSWYARALKIRKRFATKYSTGAGSFSKSPRRRQLMSRKHWEKWFCTCVLSLCTFLCTPLQNDNMKWQSRTSFGDRVPILPCFPLEMNASISY